MPRPSPFLLHGWLSEWWRNCSGAQPRVQVANRNGELVAALRLCMERRHGLRVTRFMGGTESAVRDLLLADHLDPRVGAELAARAAAEQSDFADLSGLDASSRLVAALGPNRLRLVEMVGSPVLDLSPGGSRCTERRPTRRSAISTSAAGASSRSSADSRSALRAPKTSSSRRSRNPFASTRFAGRAAPTGQAGKDRRHRDRDVDRRARAGLERSASRIAPSPLAAGVLASRRTPSAPASAPRRRRRGRRGP
jgi:hypothetical protein